MRTRRLAILVVLTITLAFLPSAFAQSQAPAAQSATPLDSVALRDGTILRGHVTIMRPGTDLTIVLLDGTARTVTWSDVRSTDGPAFAFANPSTSALTVPPAPPTTPLETDLRDPGPGRVPIVLESVGTRVSVGESMGALTGWNARVPLAHQELCFTPCTLYVRPGLFPLFVGGDGIVPTIVRLDVPPTGLRLRLRSPRTAMIGGMLAVEVGALLTATVGLDLLIFQPRSSATGPDPGWEAAGWTLIAAGGIGLIADFVGFGLALRNGVASSSPLDAHAPAPRWMPSLAPVRDGAVVTLAHAW